MATDSLLSIPLGLCGCGCGRRTPIAIRNLRSSGTLAGQPMRFCIGHRRRLDRIYKRPFEWIFHKLIQVSHGLQVTITYEDFLEFTAVSECHYCGAKIIWVGFPGRNIPGSYAYNLDRKDNAVGYVKEKLVVCCKRCNRSKSSSFTYEEWVAIGNIIRSFDRRIPCQLIQ